MDDLSILCPCIYTLTGVRLFNEVVCTCPICMRMIEHEHYTFISIVILLCSVN